MGSRIDIGDPHSISQGSHQVHALRRVATTLTHNTTTERKKSCFVKTTVGQSRKKCSIDATELTAVLTQIPTLHGNVDSDLNKKTIVPAETEWVGGINVSKILAYREEEYQKRASDNLIAEQSEIDGKDINIKVEDKKDGESISVSMPDSSEMRPDMRGRDLGD